jgi:MFS family permease
MSASSKSDPAALGSVQRSTSLGVIFLVLFLDLVGFSILFPLYGKMLDHYSRTDQGMLSAALGWVATNFPDASATQREALFGGLLGALYSCTQFIVAPLWGRLSDRVGRRPILLTSIIGNLVAYLLWAFSSTFSLLLLSRFLAGLIGGAAVTANAAVADITGSPRARARGMGLVGMAFGMGFILGPVIGGLTASPKLRLDGIAALQGIGLNPFSTPALIAAGLTLINLVWALPRFRETLSAERRASARGSDRTANPLRLFSAALGPTVVVLNLSFLLHTVLFAGMESTLVFLVQHRLPFPDPDSIYTFNGMLFGWMGFIAALMQGGFFRRLAPRIGGRPLAIAGFLLLIPGFALIGLVDWHPTTLFLWLGVTVLAAGTGLVFPSLNTLVSLATDERHQGLALGTFRSAGSLGRAIGPLLAAVTYFHFRPAAPYLIAAVGAILPLALMIRLRPVTVGEARGE